VPGSALVVVVDLGTWAFQEAVVEKQFQSAEKLLRTSANEGDNLARTEKTMPVNKPDDFAVTLGQLHWGNFGCAFETGKAGRFHRFTLLEIGQTEKAPEFARWGKA